MIWWLWTAFDPVEVHVFDVVAGLEAEDIAWLGEGGWVFRNDTMGLGLRTV